MTERLSQSNGSDVVSASLSSLSREQLPKVNKFGLNGDYLICTYGQLTSNVLIQHGVKSSLIRGTGYPYLDRFVVASKERRPTRRSNGRPRLLIVSTGHGIFGDLLGARRFYDFLSDIISPLGRDYEIVLRLKPGEDVTLFLDDDRIEQLRSLSLKYDDNTVPSLQALPQYDLVLGDASSVLLEAIILNIPVIVFSYSGSFQTRYKCSMESILRNDLGILALESASEAPSAMKYALSIEYAAELRSRLETNSEFLFNGLDGQASDRVGRVMLEALSRI